MQLLLLVVLVVAVVVLVVGCPSQAAVVVAGCSTALTCSCSPLSLTHTVSLLYRILLCYALC